MNPPVVLSSTYLAGGPVSYGRVHNPTWGAFETAVGALEGGPALAFASGMAAITAVVAEAPPGARVVAPHDAYMGTRALLAERARVDGLDVRLVDVTDTRATLDACGGAALLWLESPTNPCMQVADLPALLRGARACGIRTAVDNTFATPVCQRPLELGADVVVHSVSKFLAGHSDVLLGATVTGGPDAGELHERLHGRRTLGGAVPGAMETWLALRGLRTLGVRVERGQASAGELAARLQGHRAVLGVRYPGLPDDPGHARAAAQMHGFGAMLAFEVHGGAVAAEQVCARTDVLTHATSLGGVESLIERRGRWEGEERTPPGLLRISVGCEDVEDLWHDLRQALDELHAG